ncbi:MAG: autotransporter-associated beta strand repeat-containing protein [Kiritimatiellae bacterium]|nr:autotransporter-associated beta strand repeat-containing protein [Kiritimatiellia bacterium]
MKKLLYSIGMVCVAFSASALETVGTVYVDLDAADLSASGVGAEVNIWRNNGTEGDFASINGTGGPTFQMRDGIPVVRFSGVAANVMTNGTFGTLPEALCGENKEWTMEAWVFCPTVSGTCTYFATTPRGSNWTSKVCEFRYSAAADNAVEHYGSGKNASWGSNITWPTAGEWHHIVCVHQNAYTKEFLYLDGRLVYHDTLTLNIASDTALFTLGGVWNVNSSTWVNPFSGDIARLRFQSGNLTPEQVLRDYAEGNATFKRVDRQNALWNGTEWVNGVAPAADRGLIVNAEGSVVNTDITTGELRPISGSLTIDGANVTVTNTSTISANARWGWGGNRIALEIASGALNIVGYKGSSYIHVFGDSNGAGSVLTVGGDPQRTALLDDSNNFYAGYGVNSAMTLNIKTNGTIHTSGVAYIGHLADGHAEVHMEPGAQLLVDDWLRFGNSSAYCSADIAAGAVVSAKSHCILGALNATGTVHLAGSLYCSTLFIGEGDAGIGILDIAPGGYVSAVNIRPYNTAGTGTLTVDGGTINASAGGTILDSTIDEFFIGENGLTIDVGEGVTTSSSVALSNAENAVLTKTGSGELLLGGDNFAFTGDIVLSEGTLVFIGDNALPGDYAGTLTVADGTSIGWDAVGGAARLLSLLPKDAVCSLRLYGNNTAENLDLSEYPGVTLVVTGSVMHNGTITPYDNLYVFKPAVGANWNYTGLISDANGIPARVIVRGASPTASLILSGANSGMTGGITVESGKLVLGSPTAAGFTGTIAMSAGTVIQPDADLGRDFLNTRIQADGPVQILLTANSAHFNVDLGKFPIGTLIDSAPTSLTGTGTILPNVENTITLGGGATAWVSSSNTGYRPLLSDQDSGVQVKVSKSGLVNLSNPANSYSQGTVIASGGAVFATEDGFGAVPAEKDPDNITIDGGTLRSGNANFTLAATRGIFVGANGAEFHPWGTYCMTVLGDLSGNGAIKFTDGGFLRFAGSENTYNGRVTLRNASSRMYIGNGGNFSWASTGGIDTAGGTVYLDSNGDNDFGDIVSGAGGLIKDGSGTVTLTAPQTYTGTTRVNAGCLVQGAGSAMSAGALSVAAGAEFVTAGNLSGRFFGSGKVVVDNGVTSTVTSGNASQLIAQVNAGGTLNLSDPAVFSHQDVLLNGGTLGLSAGDYRENVLTGFANWFVQGSNCTANISSDGSTLHLTDNKTYCAATAFWPERVDISQPWSVSFTYKTGAMTSTPADGFSFILHNSPPLQIGRNGGSLGMTVFNPSVGVYANVYSNPDQVGFIINAGKVDGKGISGFNFQSGNAKWTISYDGVGTLTQTVTVGSTTQTYTKSVNITNQLNSTTAFVGFTAATGGSSVDQNITDFTSTFKVKRYPSMADLAGIIDASNWYLIDQAKIITTNGAPAIRLTTQSGSLRAAATMAKKLDVSRPFTARFTYLAFSSGTPADGAAFFLHNNATNTIGNTGGAVGYSGGFTSSIGWSVNIYGDQYFRWLKNGNFVANYGQMKNTGINLVSGTPTTIELSYDLTSLNATATQNGVVVAADCPEVVDLVDYFGTKEVYLGISAATGGAVAEQWVTGIEVMQDDLPMTSVHVTAAGSTISAAESAVVETVTMDDGSDFAVNGSALAAYKLSLLGGAGINGNVTVGEITFAETGTLAVNGAMDKLGDRIVLHVPPFADGRKTLIDLTQCPGLTLEDFLLDTPAVDGVETQLVLRDGILYAVRDIGTLILLY